MQEPLLAVGKVCRDEGAGRVCMRATYATRDIQVRGRLWRLPAVACKGCWDGWAQSAICCATEGAEAQTLNSTGGSV